MKFTAILALFLAGAEAVRVEQPVQVAQASNQAGLMSRLEQMSDDDIQKLVNDAVKKNQEEHAKKSMATKTDEAKEKDGEFRAVEAVLAKRILDRLRSTGYYGYRYPLSGDLYDKVAALHAYHDMILGYELQNAIVAQAVNPIVSEVLQNLGRITDNSGMIRKDPSPFHDSPPTGAALQLTELGVPVMMEPHNLRTNELAEADLRQRNYVIDGVDGYAFVQRNDIFDDTVVLQVKGKAKKVSTELNNEMADYHFEGNMRIGPDSVNFL